MVLQSPVTGVVGARAFYRLQGPRAVKMLACFACLRKSLFTDCRASEPLRLYSFYDRGPLAQDQVSGLQGMRAPGSLKLVQ